MKIQLGIAIGQGVLVSIAGQVDTRTGIAPVLGQYRVRGSRIAGIAKYHAELAMETPPAEFLFEEPAPGPEPAAFRRCRLLRDSSAEPLTPTPIRFIASSMCWRSAIIRTIAKPATIISSGGWWKRTAC